MKSYTYSEPARRRARHYIGCSALSPASASLLFCHAETQAPHLYCDQLRQAYPNTNSDWRGFLLKRQPIAAGAVPFVLRGVSGCDLCRLCHFLATTRSWGTREVAHICALSPPRGKRVSFLFLSSIGNSKSPADAEIADHPAWNAMGPTPVTEVTTGFDDIKSLLCVMLQNA